MGFAASFALTSISNVGSFAALTMDEPSWLEKARGYIELGMLDEALRQIDALPSQKRGTPAAQEMRIIISLNRGDLDEAFALSEDLCDLHPESHAGFIQGAYCLHAMERTQDAIDFLQAGPGTLRDEPVYFYNLACYELALGKRQAAVTWLKQSLEMDPTFREKVKTDTDLAEILEELDI